MAEDTMLTEAIEAIRQGKKAQAKDLLTRLIRADQHNATYWVWMSAAVETQKERLYALQTALRADPENAAAKRGLVLLGAMQLEEGVQPFPMDRPRLWEDELIEEEEEKATGIKGFVGNPIVRLGGIVIGIVGIIGFAIFGLVTRNVKVARPTITPGPSPTYTLTPTALNAKPEATPVFIGPTPLWALLDATYTPTPLYVQTPRSVQASDYGHAVRSAYEDEDWEALITSMEQIAILEPESADPHYYIGEAYRFMGENTKAFNAYEAALDIDKNFGPAYLGRARVLRYINANARRLPDLDKAIENDPYFAESYLERAIYWYEDGEYENALEDLEIAEQLAPNSAQVFLTYARTYLAQEMLEDALSAAEKALEIDRTNLETYLLLGQLYEANDQLSKAVEVLELYTIYEEEDTEALSVLGGAYYEAEEYDKAIEILDTVLDLDRHAGKAYYYRGLSYLALEDGENAINDLEQTLRYLKDSFNASISLAQAHILVEHYGDCYLQVERTRPLAETEYEEALIYYWRATCHEGREDISAAIADWENLIEMPFSAEIGYLRAEARQHLGGLYTPTPTNTVGPTSTPTMTLTPTPSYTPTITPTPSDTPTPKTAE
ncbi:MAG: tetratricopeptide repeat protein [Anaerolineae bacterium]|jgi:tetratricopeptide (TPR) repeat protein|nr:tetratricopeptide repeat protein [Anaerolineae bacterium]MBT7072169.1 tetratricopeptide repeat protein [Anaerolineae bacterium]MBT7324289.1 tetratricopeptide repeat protein [Anaerolineae bacterium]